MKPARHTKKNLPGKTTQSSQEHTKVSTAHKDINVESLIAYRKKGLTLEEIASLTGCTKQTVDYHLKRIDFEGLDQFRDGKDIIFEHHQRRVVNSLTDDDIKSASMLQRVTAAAILQDKIQVIRGQATEIIDHRVMVLDLGKAIQAMRAEQGQDAITVDNPVDIVVDKCPNG